MVICLCLPQGERRSIGSVCVQHDLSGGGLLQGEVHAEGHCGAVPHQVGEVQWYHANATPRSGKNHCLPHDLMLMMMPESSTD